MNIWPTIIIMHPVTNMSVSAHRTENTKHLCCVGFYLKKQKQQKPKTSSSREITRLLYHELHSLRIKNVLESGHGRRGLGQDNTFILPSFPQPQEHPAYEEQMSDLLKLLKMLFNGLRARINTGFKCRLEILLGMDGLNIYERLYRNRHC